METVVELGPASVNRGTDITISGFLVQESDLKIIIYQHNALVCLDGQRYSHQRAQLLGRPPLKME
jgi:hypothetical protein